LQTDQSLDFSVIIVNYNTSDFLAGCLDSIGRPANFLIEVIVVDNDSHDDSVNMVKQRFPWVRLIAQEQNVGFARANNQALKLCKSHYVFFLNPDTQLNRGAFAAMAKFMDAHPTVGLAGTKIIYPDGSVQSSVERRYPGQRHAKQDLQGLTGDIAWVLGAAMVARRDVIDALGGFDEDYFLYGEDQDLCLRLRRAGWDIGYIPEAVVTHWEGQSERNNLRAVVWNKKFDAELLFYKKHYSAQAIRAIRRNNVLKAYWRIFSMRIRLLFSPQNRIISNKLEKYKILLKVFSQKNVYQ
jgi:N-acetylglucosaminyl-diphospho-decaprenol L-rhamnosyltransferase